METAEMHYLGAVAGYRMTDHRSNENSREMGRIGISKATQVKVKLSLCLTKHHAMKTYCGSGSIASLIL
jgi:hypothetical protein